MKKIIIIIILINLINSAICQIENSYLEFIEDDSKSSFNEFIFNNSRHSTANFLSFEATKSNGGKTISQIYHSGNNENYINETIYDDEGREIMEVEFDINGNIVSTEIMEYDGSTSIFSKVFDSNGNIDSSHISKYSSDGSYLGYIGTRFDLIDSLWVKTELTLKYDENDECCRKVFTRQYGISNPYIIKEEIIFRSEGRIDSIHKTDVRGDIDLFEYRKYKNDGSLIEIEILDSYGEKVKYERFNYMNGYIQEVIGYEKRKNVHKPKFYFRLYEIK